MAKNEIEIDQIIFPLREEEKDRKKKTKMKAVHKFIIPAERKGKGSNILIKQVWTYHHRRQTPLQPSTNVPSLQLEVGEDSMKKGWKRCEIGRQIKSALQLPLPVQKDGLDTQNSAQHTF